MKLKDLIQHRKAIKEFSNRTKITRQAKMLEVCGFLKISLNTIYVYQNRKRKTQTGRINKLGYRLLMNADLNTLAFFLNDKNFKNDYFIADDRDLLELNTIKYDEREIITKGKGNN